MRNEMKLAVDNMLQTDPTVADELREMALAVLGLGLVSDEKKVTAIHNVLSGETDPDMLRPIFTRREAGRVLKLKPHSVDRLGRLGMLHRVYGSGTRVIGFTRQSVQLYCEGKITRPGTYPRDKGPIK